MIDTPVWEDGACTPLAALHDDIEVDVCVIGLGGSGLAAVQRLLELGQRVAAVDAGMIGGGAAGRNGGFLLAGLPAFYHDAVDRFGRDRVRALYLKTVAELDRMTAETPSAIRRVGSLRIADDDAELIDCEAQLAVMRRDGLPVERYEGVEGRGILMPTDGAYNPLLRCRLLAKRALADGALLFERSPATCITGQLVRSGNGTIRCQRAIVAVDGGLDRLLPELAPRVRSAPGGRVPTRGPLSCVHTSPRNVHTSPPICGHIRVVCTTRGDEPRLCAQVRPERSHMSKAP
jgi:glycine/D-amino acid oxidase-like deaminating enzyme